MFDETRVGGYARVSLGLGCAILLYYLVFRPAYNLWFHPLAKYPGPKLWAISQVPWAVAFSSGKFHLRLGELHEKYGTIVRVGPDELSYTVPEAWNDVMGERKGHFENAKAPWYDSPDEHDIIGASYHDHVRMRKLLSYGFSTSAMVQQQSLIIGYVDLLIQRLHEKTKNGQAVVDICSWYNYCTFDIIGDLAFGEPFGSLEGSELHPWITLLLGNIRKYALAVILKRFTLTRVLLPYLVPPKLKRQSAEFLKISKEKVAKRLAVPFPRPDLMEVMKGSGKGSGLTMTREELERNANLLTVAGSETTATTLSGATYLLAKNPDVMAKLAEEIHASFSEEKEMDLLSTAKLTYLSAVIHESLRVFPPVPNIIPRITPSGGNTVLGEHLPAGTVLNIPQRPLFYDEANFKRAKEFIPERWLPDATEFANDRRDCFNPFSFGPRNCIGMNLAYAESRLILARMLWNFDIHVAARSDNWMEEQQAYLMWDKTPLYMHLSPRDVTRRV